MLKMKVDKMHIRGNIEQPRNKRATHNAYMKSCCSLTNIGSAISKFHVMVAKGPVHICTCHDQLWST